MDNSIEIKMPKWIWIIFIIAMPGSVLFLFELLYEMTYLTWTKGLQMIGFSLMHAYTFWYLYFILSFFTLLVWIFIISFWCLKHRRLFKFTKKILLAFFTSVLILILICLPERFYQRITIRLLGNSAYNNEFFINAAGFGDIRSMKFYLNRGVDINCETKYGNTALMTASLNNHKEIVEYLISKSADPNKSDHLKSTALNDAVSEGNFEIAKLLVDNGANIISLRRLLRDDSIKLLTGNFYSRQLKDEYKKRDSLLILFLKDFDLKSK